MSYRALWLKLQYLLLLVLIIAGLLRYTSWPPLIAAPLGLFMAAIITLITALLMARWLDE